MRRCFNGAADRDQRKAGAGVVDTGASNGASTGPLIEISGKFRGPVRPGVVDVASTGPLIEISGKVADYFQRHDCGGSASTGPLIEISGKQQLREPSWTITTARFNGAADRDQRKASASASPSPRRCGCFNGAADRDQRKAPRVARPTDPTSRASTGPLIEISGKRPPVPGRVDRDRAASTGPLIEISGKSCRGRGRGGSAGFNGAADRDQRKGTAPPTPRPPSAPSFNGAADRDQRKAASSARHRARWVTSGFNGAADRDQRKARDLSGQCRSACRASTGPLIEISGKPAMIRALAGRGRTLQRGR